MPTVEDGKLFCGWYLNADCSGAALRTITEPLGDLKLYGQIVDTTITIEDVVFATELFIDEATGERHDPHEVEANGLHRWENVALGLDEKTEPKIITFEMKDGKLVLGDNLEINSPDGISVMRKLESSGDLSTWQPTESAIDANGNYLIPMGGEGGARFFRIRYAISN